MVKGTIKKHLEKIESGLQLVATNVNSLKDSIEGHNDRIVKIETDIKHLNGKVDNLVGSK
jgi:archaellum component FlaC